MRLIYAPILIQYKFIGEKNTKLLFFSANFIGVFIFFFELGAIEAVVLLARMMLLLLVDVGSILFLYHVL